MNFFRCNNNLNSNACMSPNWLRSPYHTTQSLPCMLLALSVVIMRSWPLATCQSQDYALSQPHVAYIQEVSTQLERKGTDWLLRSRMPQRRLLLEFQTCVYLPFCYIVHIRWMGRRKWKNAKRYLRTIVWCACGVTVASGGQGGINTKGMMI